MSKTELDRSIVIGQVVAKQLPQAKAALMLGLSTRQIKQLVRRFKREGPHALGHRGRGKPSRLFAVFHEYCWKCHTVGSTGCYLV